MTDPESKNTKGIQEVYNFLILEYFPTAHEINDQIMNLLQVHRMQSDFQPVIDQFDAFVEINNFSRGLLEINARNLLSQKIEIKQMFLDLVNSFIQFINEIRENYANVLTDDDYLHFKQSGEKLKNTSHLIIFPENPSKQKILDLFYKDNYVGNKDPNHYLDKFLMLTFFRLNCSEPKQKTFSILLTSIFKKRIDYLLNLKCYVENTDSTDEDHADCRNL